MEKPLVQIDTKQWLGRVSNASPHKLPPGAAVIQENLRCQTPGQMDVRPGTRTTIPNASGTIIACVAYTGFSAGDYFVYQTSDGTISAIQALT